MVCNKEVNLLANSSPLSWRSKMRWSLSVTQPLTTHTHTCAHMHAHTLTQHISAHANPYIHIFSCECRKITKYCTSHEYNYNRFHNGPFSLNSTHTILYKKKITHGMHVLRHSASKNTILRLRRRWEDKQ